MLSKQSLLTSAKELFYKYGIKSVSMDDIARLLGISKKTIYNFVENKKDLVESVILAYIEEEKEVIDKISSDSENAIDEMTQIARFVLKSLRSVKPTLSYDLQKYHPKAWTLLQTDHMNYIEKVIKRNITRGMNEGLYRTDLDVEIYSKIYVGLGRMMMDNETFSDQSIALGDIYEHIILYHLNGIMDENGRKVFNNYMKTERA